MKYIGIDMGSSFVKSVLFDLDRGTVAIQNKIPSPPRIPDKNANYFEVPAKELAETVKSLIDRYAEEYNDIEGAIIATQMHGFVYSVPGRGDLYISWQDMRCMDKMPGEDITWLKYLEGLISEEDMVTHGVYLKPSLAVCNLYTLLNLNKEIPGNGVMYTLGSYVINVLTGNNVCHISNAAPMGLADVKNHCWDLSLKEHMGFAEVELPRMSEGDYEVCGIYTSHGNKIKIFPDYGDMQISILGSCLREGDVAVNIATGAQVIRYGSDFTPGSYEIRPYFEGGNLYTISNMPSGRNLDVLIQFLRDSAEKITGREISAQEVWKAVHEADISPDPDLRVKTSFYRNPYFPDGGGISGITHGNLCIGTLFYASFRDMAETYWHFLGELGRDREEIKRIVCAGGVNWKTPEIRQMLSEVSGKVCVLSPMADESLLGMYQMSLLCSGKCKSLAECGAHMLKA